MKSSVNCFILPLLFLLNNSACSTNESNDTPQEEAIPVTYFYTGNANINTNPQGGLCLMGGRTENDNAMRWFLNKANGGDVLVLRASGSDGYNNYFYSELGVTINSVETIVFKGKTEAEEIISKIDNAEALWFAGGDQEKYINYWKDNLIEEAIQRAIDRNCVIGGTSAGMAIMGEFVWTGEQIVTNFLEVPFMQGIITDTHFSERNRMPRLQDFINQTNAKGIAADEYTAICIDTDGIARVYGDENEDDIAFFVDEQLEVTTVKGTNSGSSSFNVVTWQ